MRIYIFILKYCTQFQYRCKAADSLSQLSGSSASSRESILLAAADVRRRLAAAEEHAGAHAFRNTKDPSAQALKVLISLFILHLDDFSQ